jgi:predicted esterase
MDEELIANDARVLGIMNRRVTTRYLGDPTSPPVLHDLAARTQAAFVAKDYPLAYRLVSELLLRHRGIEPGPATELATALDFRLDHRLLGPGDPLTISLEPVLALHPRGGGTCHASFQLSDLAGQFNERLPGLAVHEVRTFRIPVDTSGLSPGKYAITYKLQAPDGRPLVECRRDFVIDPDARPRHTSLRRRYDHIRNALQHPTVRQVAALETIDFVLEQMGLALDTYAAAMNYRSLPMTVKLRGVDLARYDNDPFDSQRDLPLVESLLQDLEARKDPLAHRSGDLRLAFRSKQDGSLQPYRLYVPEGWQGLGPMPAVLALHGATGDEHTYFERYFDQRTGRNLFKQLGQEYGYLLAAPNGRGPFGNYVDASERDVLEVLESIQKLWPVNSSQVFLTGHSMGGYGTWNIGFRHPELFAALAPVAGRPADALAALLDKAPEKPVFFCVGLNDVIVTPAKTSEWAAIARRQLLHFEYREYPKDDHFAIGLTSMRAIFEFFEQVRRKR